MSKIRVYIIGHKYFVSPTISDIYIPMYVGDSGEFLSKKTCELNDAIGDNISSKNRMFNELTGMYWVWKNSDAEIVGICHYRRYFTTVIGKILNILFKRSNIVLSEKKIRHILNNYDWIVHNKTFFRETNIKQLTINNNSTKDNSNKSKLSDDMIKVGREVFYSIHPEDIEFFDEVCNSKSAHLLNMCITKKTLFDQYCEWVFPILFRYEEDLLSIYDEDKLNRAVGLFAERLLDVWLVKNKNLRIRECFSVNTERTDWKMWA